jgi:pyridoxine 4-dehydrogenase
VSNFKLDELERAQRVVPIVSVQNRYNASDRTSQAMLDACTRQRLAFIPWAPIASGSVSKLETENDSKGLQVVAQARGVSVFQVAIAWLLAQSPAMLPIPGTSSVEHLQENVAAAAIKLTPAEISAIG